MDIKIKDGLKGIKGHIKCQLFDLEGNLIETKEYDNMVVNVYKNAVAGQLNNEGGSFTNVINYGAVGTDTSSPALTDTQLVAEVARTIVDDSSRTANVITLDFYFDLLTGNGLLKEFGAFVDGTAVANTGILFDRVNIDINKTSLNSLRITLTITIS